MRQLWLVALFFGSTVSTAFSQCNALRPQVSIDFNTDQDCAPVTVTQYQITYFFNASQNPTNIEIRYEWNDPANTVTTVNMGNGLVAGAGNTSFQANATFTYVTNNSCTITPTATLYINGVACPTSEQVQTAFFWGTDEEGNGNVVMTPDDYEVCFGNPVVNATFRDNTEFNCNIGVEPDNPNRFARHVQFVYGTNHNAGSTIRNLSLVDGGTQGLTNAAGSLVSSATRGTGAVTVTAGYFGPIQTVPFPADGPNAVTFPMNAPADAANLVGNRFEITLFNWNTCNPWNGDPVNPNYEDAELTRGYIVIIAAPAPAFETRDSNGLPTQDFCINEAITFANQTPNANQYNHSWQFYDDATGTSLVGTSNSRNPTFSFSSGGTKLIRLTSSNPSAQGACRAEVTHTVNITPQLVATIGVTDLGGNPLVPDFCQEFQLPLSSFNVRFTDLSTGTATPNTQWRWEFFDQTNSLIAEFPSGGGFSATPLGPFDRVFQNKGTYRIRLVIRDNVTLCETEDEKFVRVFEKPRPLFTAAQTCEGTPTQFEEASTLNALNGESIVLREWDFDYDGVTFQKDAAFDNQQSFTKDLGGAGAHSVALRVTTNQTGCSAITVLPVTVHELPQAQFTASATEGCSILSVTFMNSVISQATSIMNYQWEIDEGTGFVVVASQDPTTPGFTGQLIQDFDNTSTVNKVIQVRLRAISTAGCEQVSPVERITVYPGTASGFSSIDYSPFASNCSPQTIHFKVDAATQALSPTNYRWQVFEGSSLVADQSSGTNPDFAYTFQNTGLQLQDFNITLTTTLVSGCFGDSSRTVRIAPVPSSKFTIDTLEYTCEQVRIRVEAEQPGLASYQWKMTENGITTIQSNTLGDSFEHAFVRSSTSDVVVDISLVTVNLANCTSGVTTEGLVVTKVDGINAFFTATPPSQTLPSSTVQVVAITPGPWQYRWDFGDGTTSSRPTSDSHAYSAYGTFQIMLTVSNFDCSTTQTQSVTLLLPPPIIDFDFEPASGCAPLKVSFTNKTQYGEADQYVWTFGDGQATSTAVDPAYSYNEPGKYSVTLRATNATGQTSLLTKENIIEVYPVPSAQFEVKPQLITGTDGLLYTSNRSFGATEFTWDFGDGTTSTEREPVHSYGAEGEYEVQLIARNIFDCADTARLSGGVKVRNGGNLLVPNAFSPNLSGSLGDGGGVGGKNDVFLPLLRGVTNFEMLIFNRWGELLFQTTSPTVGWDGYYQGKLCQQDVYMYRITAEFETGEKLVKVGDVNLIR